MADPKIVMSGALKPVQAQPFLHIEKGDTVAVPQFTPKFVEAQSAGTPPPVNQLTSPQRWSLGGTPPKQSSYNQWLDQYGPAQQAAQRFMAQRSGWVDALGQEGDFVPMAVAGAVQFRQRVANAIYIYDQVRASLNSSVAQSTVWQDPAVFAEITKNFQFVATFVPIIEDIITVSQNQRALVAQDAVLKYATPLTSVALQDFFIALAVASNEDPLTRDMAPQLLGKAAHNIQVLAEYGQVTTRYQAALNRLKQLTSPLVGVDVPWQGQYEAEYQEPSDLLPTEQDPVALPAAYNSTADDYDVHKPFTYNPSTVPTEYLNAWPLQKAFHAAMGGPLEAEYRHALRGINHDPASPEQLKSEMMADAAWDAEAKKFTPWHGHAWSRMEEIVDRRSAVVAWMEALAKDAESHQSKDPPTLSEAIRLTESNIKNAGEVLTVMKSTWDTWYMPTIDLHLNRLQLVSVKLSHAQTEIELAKNALTAKDDVGAGVHYLQAQRHYILAVGTPRFKSLATMAGDYQALSIYPKLGAMVITTAASAGFGALAFLGTRGALTAAGLTGIRGGALLIQGGAHLANAATFSVSAAHLNHLLLKEKLPDGVKEWGYEIGSTAILFRFLAKVAQRWGKPAGEWATERLTHSLGARATTVTGKELIAKGTWVAEMGPTALFFAGWTPLDQMAQQYMDHDTFTPLIVIIESLKPQSLLIQLSFLLGLGGANRLLAALPGVNKLGESAKAYVKTTFDARVEQLTMQRAALNEKMTAFRKRSATDPAAVVTEGAPLMTKAVALAREELNLHILSGNKDSVTLTRKAQLKSMITTYSGAAKEFKSMATMTAVFEQAQVRTIGTGIAGYDPLAAKAIRGLCRLKSSKFSLRDVGNGNFVFTWKGSSGDRSEVTLVPTPKGPVSAATDIVPVQK